MQTSDTLVEVVRSTPEGLIVGWCDAAQDTLYPWLWLRDHGEDESSLAPDTQQRRVNTFAIAATAPASAATLLESQHIELRWADNGPATQVSPQRLHAFREPQAQRALLRAPDSVRFAPGVEPWSAPPPTPPAALDFDELLGSDATLAAWLGALRQRGYCVIEHVPPTAAAAERLARRLAPPKQTVFGQMWPLSAELHDHEDSAYSDSYLEPHTDGTYYHDAAGLQMFSCLEFDGSGGESLLVDGYAIAQALRRAHPQDFAMLSETVVPGQYLEPGVHLRAERPALRFDAEGHLQQVSFNNYDRAPFRLPNDQMGRFYQAYCAFHNLLCEEARWAEIALRPGMALIFDNWRLLHGRRAYTGKRVFEGCYHDRADFESRWRVLCDR